MSNDTRKPIPIKPNRNTNSSNKNQQSKWKTFSVIIIFLLLFGLVIFMPEINKFIDNLKPEEEIIVAPKKEENKLLTCKLTKNVDSTQVKISLSFQYVNNLLKKATLKNEINEITDDQTKVDEQYQNCKTLEKTLEASEGIEQNCLLKDNTFTITQSIDYEILEPETAKMNVGKIEGFYPEFVYNQDIKIINSVLNEDGYNCSSSNEK